MITTLEGLNLNRTINLKQIYSDPLIKLKKYVDAYTSIGPSLDKNGFPTTGLTEDTKEVVTGNKIPKTIKGTRKEMEGLLDLPEGTLKQQGKIFNFPMQSLVNLICSSKNSISIICQRIHIFVLSHLYVCI
jgi:hypothetical protein